MQKFSVRRSYWQGARDGAPFVLVVVPFAMVFGLVATESGLAISEVMAFSVLVIAGAAQLAALQLMNENAPTLIVIATALAVNLRVAMYSASLAPHLGRIAWWKRGFMAYFIVDQSYAISMLKYEQTPKMSPSAKAAYFFGTITPVCLPWYGATWLGAVLGGAIPPALSLDFAVPITFIAVIAPMLRTAAHVAAAMVSVLGALALGFLPYSIGLLIAGVAAMAAGAQVELWMQRRRAGG